MIKHTVRGDLLEMFEEKAFRAIVHGCNCWHIMGAGIAGQIARKYPVALEMDKLTGKGDPKKLGSWSYAGTPHGTIINAYTQLAPGRENPYFLNSSIKEVFTKLNASGLTKKSGDFIGIPKIGSGIAGGDWNEISDIINEYTPDLNIILVEYQPN